MIQIGKILLPSSFGQRRYGVIVLIGSSVKPAGRIATKKPIMKQKIRASQIVIFWRNFLTHTSLFVNLLIDKDYNISALSCQ